MQDGFPVVRCRGHDENGFGPVNPKPERSVTSLDDTSVPAVSTRTVNAASLIRNPRAAISSGCGGGASAGGMGERATLTTERNARATALRLAALARQSHHVRREIAPL
jgi:hypothetical protein